MFVDPEAKSDIILMFTSILYGVLFAKELLQRLTETREIYVRRFYSEV